MRVTKFKGITIANLSTGSCNVAAYKDKGTVWLGLYGMAGGHVSIKEATELRDALNIVLNEFGPNVGYVEVD